VTLDERPPIVEHRALRDHFGWSPQSGPWIAEARATDAEFAAAAALERAHLDDTESDAAEKGKWATRMALSARDREPVHYEERGAG
jgi:hypothetical protein